MNRRPLVVPLVLALFGLSLAARAGEDDEDDKPDSFLGCISSHGLSDRNTSEQEENRNCLKTRLAKFVEQNPWLKGEPEEVLLQLMAVAEAGSQQELKSAYPPALSNEKNVSAALHAAAAKQPKSGKGMKLGLRCIRHEGLKESAEWIQHGGLEVALFPASERSSSAFMPDQPKWWKGDGVAWRQHWERKMKRLKLLQVPAGDGVGHVDVALEGWDKLAGETPEVQALHYCGEGFVLGVAVIRQPTVDLVFGGQGVAIGIESPQFSEMAPRETRWHEVWMVTFDDQATYQDYMKAHPTAHMYGQLYRKLCPGKLADSIAAVAKAGKPAAHIKDLYGDERWKCFETKAGAAKSFLQGRFSGPPAPLEDLAALVSYTSADYEIINRSLYAPDQVDAKERELIAKLVVPAIQRALASLKPYKGTVYRGVKNFKTFAGRYQKDKDVVEPQFLSSSFEMWNALSGDALFVIQSKTGRFVHGFSEYTLNTEDKTSVEVEVLFSAGTAFRMLKSDKYIEVIENRTRVRMLEQDAK